MRLEQDSWEHRGDSPSRRLLADVDELRQKAPRFVEVDPSGSRPVQPPLLRLARPGGRGQGARPAGRGAASRSRRSPAALDAGDRGCWPPSSPATRRPPSPRSKSRSRATTGCMSSRRSSPSTRAGRTRRLERMRAAVRRRPGQVQSPRPGEAGISPGPHGRRAPDPRRSPRPLPERPQRPVVPGPARAGLRQRRDGSPPLRRAGAHRAHLHRALQPRSRTAPARTLRRRGGEPSARPSPSSRRARRPSSTWPTPNGCAARRPKRRRSIKK